MFISPSMLEKLYLRGSLKNIETGFEFKMKNNIESGTIIGLKSMIVDEVEVPVDCVTISTNKGEKPAPQIDYRNPIYLPFATEVRIAAVTAPLPSGEHKIAMVLRVMEIGSVEVRFSDEIHPSST